MESDNLSLAFNGWYDQSMCLGMERLSTSSERLSTSSERLSTSSERLSTPSKV